MATESEHHERREHGAPRPPCLRVLVGFETGETRRPGDVGAHEIVRALGEDNPSDGADEGDRAEQVPSDMNEPDTCGADGPGAICPLCGHLSFLSLQSTDYVERPMLWCDECGARLVLDVQLDEFNHLEGVMMGEPTVDGVSDPGPPTLPERASWASHEDAATAISRFIPAVPEASHDECECGESPCLNRVWMSIPCLWITRVIPSNLGGIRLTCEANSAELADTLRVGDYYDAEERLCAAGLAEPSRVADWRLGIECGSYDVQTPAEEYPAYADFAHDGIHVYVECELANGDLERLSYWGD